jgi:hypothetical protein
MITKGINSPLTSSLGRLFDGVAAICGIRSRVNFEGQAAMELEMLAGGSAESLYDYEWEEDNILRIPPAPIIRGVVADIQNRVPLSEIGAFIELARLDDVIVTTFGDLMRVPGSNSSLQKESAEGHDIRVVYSTFDALEVAQKNPDKRVVFLGVGFETTAPTIAASNMQAAQMKVKNYSVISAHKLVHRPWKH